MTINYVINAFSPSVNILLLIVIILLTGLLIFLLARSILKERRRWSEQKEKEGTISLVDLENYLKAQLQKSKKLNFILFRIDIFESGSLFKNLGEMQYNTALEQLISKINAVMGLNTKTAVKDNDSIYIFHKAKLSPESLENLCRILMAEIQKSIIIAGALKVDFDVNIGIVTYPGGGKNIEDLMQNLQLAAVSAKRKGVNKYAFYDISLTNKESEEYKSFLEIKSAIDNKEFTLYYQPIVNLGTKEVACAESLLRWKHKVKGVLPPSTFLNIMEHTGDINWVGFWAMEQLFKQQQHWRSQYPDSKFMLSMNLSPKQLMNPALIDELKKLVRKYKVTPSDFSFEIVLNSISDMLSITKENIMKLHESGFKITVDNYGSASASVHNLSSLQVDAIKLTRGYISESRTNEFTLDIIKMLVSHAKKSNMMIIAEGIENDDDLSYAQSLGIECGQGYLFARPQTATELINSVLFTPWMAN